MQGWNIFNPELDEYINLIPAQQRVGEDWYLGTADAIYQNIYVLQMDRTGFGSDLLPEIISTR